MDHIRIRTGQNTVARTGSSIEVRCDLPYQEALDAAIEAFEAAYVDALMERHHSFYNASRSSGLAVDDLVAILERGSATAIPRRRAA